MAREVCASGLGGVRGSLSRAPRPCLSLPSCHHTHSSLASLRGPASGWMSWEPAQATELS